MSESKCNRVFILGAGCSANYGYPLGAKLVDELHQFLPKIPGGCPLIEGAVSKSIDLASRFPEANTLDKLVNLPEERFKAFRGGRGSAWQNADTDQENLTQAEIFNAKIATSALFLDCENEARKTTLKGYKEYLLPAVFGRADCWQKAINDSDCCVFTFNYDRLFEIAFLDYFRNSEGPYAIRQFALYGQSVLNSGFDPTLEWGRKRIDIKQGRFCFLKLHGSAGWWARKCARPPQPPKEEWRDYCPNSPHSPTDLVQFEQFLAANTQCSKWEPLIAFPHEKQLLTSDRPSDFIQGPYIGQVWSRAAEVLGEAIQVTVIGYSFAQIDRAHMVENLLCKTPKTTKITIENKDIEGVRHALESYPDIKDRLTLIQKCFLQDFTRAKN